jgi:Na+-transporting NADH:ubiquinone oxidoreductase subunit C
VAKGNDTIVKTIVVTLVLCIVCSVIVSTASVKLKPMQEKNKQLDFNKNLLQAAGLYQEGVPVAEQFGQVEVKLVDLETGKYSDDFDAVSFDQRKAIKDPDLSVKLEKAEDIAGVRRLERYSQVYLVNDENGELDKVILPIRGYGLWSTLYGFIALESDLNTVIGVGYYEHGETPGLGGEVDNPNWKQQWTPASGSTKMVYGADGNVQLQVIKGVVDQSASDAAYKVDGLSGATLTTVGIDNMIKFWLGDKGFKPFLTNLKAREA